MVSSSVSPSGARLKWYAGGTCPYGAAGITGTLYSSDIATAGPRIAILALVNGFILAAELDVFTKLLTEYVLERYWEQ